MPTTKSRKSKKKSTRRKSTRSAPTKKCSRRRLNSKKMRGGVTRTRSGRTRKRKIEITNIPREILRGHDKSLNARIRGFIRPALTDATIKDAVWDYIRGGTIQKQSVVTKYGDISNWDVSKVTNMKKLFSFTTSPHPSPGRTRTVSRPSSSPRHAKVTL